MILKVCPKCNTTLDEFYQTGMLGCPYCYKAFEEEIRLATAKIQGKTFHVGKNPNTDNISKQLLKEYEFLLKQKEIMGLKGDFKGMAKINADITALYEELKNRGIK